MNDKTKDDFGDLRAQVAEMGKQLALVVQRNKELEAAAVGSVLPVEDRPVYEIVNSPGYFSPDCIYYPEGVQFIDLTGTITPCEAFLPLNRAAEERMDEWLRSLPSQTRTPPIDSIMEAAMTLRGIDGGDSMNRADYFTSVMHKALELAQQAGQRVEISQPITRPVKMDGVPLMTNSRINGRQNASGVAATKYLGEGPSAADKREPPMTSKSDLLGRFAAPRVSTNR